MIDDWASYALADFVPFTPEVYVRLIERVNADGWPLQLPAVALGLACLVLAWRGRARLALGLLAPAWACSGVVFHLQRYAELNWAATWFGGAFLAQAVLLFGFALVGGGAPSRPYCTKKGVAKSGPGNIGLGKGCAPAGGSGSQVKP